MASVVKSCLELGQLTELATLKTFEGRLMWAVQTTGVAFGDWGRLGAERNKRFWMMQILLNDLVSACFSWGALWLGKGSVPNHLVDLLNVFNERIQHHRLRMSGGDVDDDQRKLLIGIKDARREQMERTIIAEQGVKLEHGVDFEPESGFVRIEVGRGSEDSGPAQSYREPDAAPTDDATPGEATQKYNYARDKHVTDTTGHSLGFHGWAYKACDKWCDNTKRYVEGMWVLMRETPLLPMGHPDIDVERRYMREWFGHPGEGTARGQGAEAACGQTAFVGQRQSAEAARRQDSVVGQLGTE